MRGLPRAVASLLLSFLLLHGAGYEASARGICPEARATRAAPPEILKRENPLPPAPEHLDRGRGLYMQDARPTPCRLCHGAYGQGDGRLAQGLAPPPRNFTCRDTMRRLSDGQLFWIIRNGSPGTGMPAHKRTLKDADIWRLILYIRRFTMPGGD